jgi:N-carbamoylputrescine amidase
MNDRSSPNLVTTALVQMRAPEDPAATLSLTLERIDEAASAGAQIICLQELFHARYFCQEEDATNFSLAEPATGPMITALAKRARVHGIVLIAPFFERRAPGLFHNTAAIFDADGSLLGLYRKMHIPDDPQFMEKYYFAPGDLGFRAWQTRYGRIGVGICWDQWYPETARLLALQGAEILFFPTAIGWIPADAESPEIRIKQHDAWQTAQRAHAIANGCFVAAANRVGAETSPSGNQIEFWGRSFVADPAGAVVAEASGEEESVLIAELDLGSIEQQRISWPFLRDRRIDAYGALGSRFLEADLRDGVASSPTAANEEV